MLAIEIAFGVALGILIVTNTDEVFKAGKNLGLVAIGLGVLAVIVIGGGALVYAALVEKNMAAVCMILAGVLGYAVWEALQKRKAAKSK